jgi:hypothetical protein
MRRSVRPAIADPTQDPRSLQNTVSQLKEAVEIMQGQRGVSAGDAVVRWQDLIDLGIIQPDQVPK